MSISQYKVPLTLLFILLLLTKALSKSYTKKIENKKKNECLDGLKRVPTKDICLGRGLLCSLSRKTL